MTRKHHPTEAVEPPSPTEGGRYVRNEDGSLTCVHKTEPNDREGRRNSPDENKLPADAGAADTAANAGNQE